MIIVASILTAYLLLFSDYGLIKRVSLETQVTDLEKELIQQQQITDSMNIAIKKLKLDTLEIERIAREKYGMTKPNEDIYYIKKDSK
jgi:cell division protein FtsB